jgi:6-phosphogluconolactonase/glucosamine-6-phosphate isomerase/deaminase
MASPSFYKISDEQHAVQYMADKLQANLEHGEKILILLPGGSALALGVKLRNLLDKQLSDVCFSLTDERFGPPGHADSNWAQLLAMGFSLQGVNYYEVLQGHSFDETVSQYREFLRSSLAKYDHVVGLFGIGSDGHTAGILPGSPAIGSKDYAVGFDAADYRRITTTPKFLASLSMAFLYTAGENKWPQLDKLEQELDISTQPVQVLKQADELTVFSDYKGEEL